VCMIAFELVSKFGVELTFLEGEGSNFIVMDSDLFFVLFCSYCSEINWKLVRFGACFYLFSPI